ncbi:hypothetical protein TrLO_g10883 [Triparma laevis f. longispina]|uniref:MPN domain-containing protein n=2 Tax=Triparma laevis TaxID=1534972 RepID=A0A9W7F5J7_9STRA|nr:hypothetical protein TrLO_g10883 [Triparma laevis f. longispina]
MSEETSTATPAPPAAGPMSLSSVVVHPLVLLSVVDHYNRVARDTRKRVVGVLLGSSHRGVVDVTNSFAVPFEEDLKNPEVWFLDHNYLENMFNMFRKVAAKERIVGFYSSGPKIKANDLKINELLGRFCKEPVFVIIDVRPNQEELPTTAYKAIEEVESEGKEIKKTFKHLPSTVGALEAEEVGVEHLLRDINDPTVSTVANRIKSKIDGLAALKEKLTEMKTYLEAVLEGKLPVNQQIMYNLQSIFNLLPNLNVSSLVTAMMVKTNDMHVVIYLSSLIRSVIALHDLVTNRIEYNAEEGGEEKKEDKKGEKKEEKRVMVKRGKKDEASAKK